MHTFWKGLAKITLLILLLFDAVVGYRLLDRGWPANIKMSSDAIQVTPLRFTLQDWIVAAGIVLLHAFLIHFIWKSRRSTA
jgi:protein-S-isoprenylcysteine O-methyltransferase Ste14